LVVDAPLRRQARRPEAARAARAVVRRRSMVRERPTRLPFHALPARPPRRRRQRPRARRPAQRRDPRGEKPHGRADGRALQNDERLTDMSKLTTSERAIAVTALRHAVPYIRMYKRKVFVLKAGGDAFVSPEMTRALLEQIGILHQVGIRVVVVHGGGPQSTELARRLGLETRM